MTSFRNRFGKIAPPPVLESPIFFHFTYFTSIQDFGLDGPGRLLAWTQGRIRAAVEQKEMDVEDTERELHLFTFWSLNYDNRNVVGCFQGTVPKHLKFWKNWLRIRIPYPCIYTGSVKTLSKYTWLNIKSPWFLQEERDSPGFAEDDKYRNQSKALVKS